MYTYSKLTVWLGQVQFDFRHYFLFFDQREFPFRREPLVSLEEPFLEIINVVDFCVFS